MELKKVSISSIKKNPNNPRVIKDDKFKKLVKSIQDFPEMLEIRPIVVNDEMIVLGGTISARNDLVECIEREVELILAQLKQAKIKPVIRNCHFRGSANLIGAVKHFLQAPKP